MTGSTTDVVTDAPPDPETRQPGPRAFLWPAGPDPSSIPDETRRVRIWPGTDWQLPRSEWIHLVYLANLGWQPFFDPGRTWVDWAVVALVVALYIPLYVLSHHPDDRIRRRALLATVVLGTVATLVNVGGSTLFVYAAATAAWVFRDRLLAWQLGLTALCGVLAVVSPVEWPYRFYGILPAVAFVWLIGWMAQADVRAHEEAERLRIDNVRIEQLATADERERIARDLHDLVGQSLTGLVVRAQLVQSLLPDDPDRAKVEAAGLEDGARDALAQVRAAIDGLNEVSLDDELDAARRTLRASGVTLVTELQAGPDRPGPLVERLLALALREATTNVVRHARAANSTIRFERTATAWRLEVADDGVGGTAPEGNGLRGMRERLMAVGGSLQRDGRHGTRVVVEVPA